MWRLNGGLLECTIKRRQDGELEAGGGLGRGWTSIILSGVQSLVMRGEWGTKHFCSKFIICSFLSVLHWRAGVCARVCVRVCTKIWVYCWSEAIRNEMLCSAEVGDEAAEKWTQTNKDGEQTWAWRYSNDAKMSWSSAPLIQAELYANGSNLFRENQFF